MTRPLTSLHYFGVFSLFVAGGLCSSTLLAQTAATRTQPEISYSKLLFDARPLASFPAQNQAAAAATNTLSNTAGNISATNSQPDDDDAGLEAEITDEAIELYLAAITDTQSKGPFSAELLEQYLSLGQAYRAEGDTDAALEAFEKAEYLSRINNGLYAPEQFRIVENMIQAYTASGDLQQAAEKQQYLLFLNQQFYGNGSLQVVPALITLADWNMDAFFTGVRGSNSVGFKLSSSAGAGSSRRAAVPPRVLAFGNLYRAQNNYYQAITNLVNNKDYRNPQLPELELKLIEGIFLGTYRQGLIDNPDFFMSQRSNSTGTRISRNDLSGFTMSYINGRNAWERLRIYQRNNPAAEPLQIARTMINQGDWQLMFNRRLQALAFYQEAYDYLQEKQLDPAQIAALLSPAVPEQVPTFTALPHSRARFGLPQEAELAYAGYFDLSFNITRYGNVRNVAVISKSDNATKRIEQRLRRLLRSTPFRPRFIDGVPARSDSVQVRYYFADVSSFD